MACGICGNDTESGEYVCNSCISDFEEKHIFGESLVFHPSIINEMDYGDPPILSIDGPRSVDSLKLIKDTNKGLSIPENLSYDLDELNDDNISQIYDDFQRIMVNIGLSYDLEERPLALLSSQDLILAQHVLKGSSEIDNKFPDHSNKNLYLLLGNMHYTLSRISSGIVTIGEREDHLRLAMQYYDRVLSISQKSYPAQKNKARVLMDLGEYEGAISCMNWILKNLKVPKDDLTVLLNLGWALHKVERYDDALKCFDSVLDRDPSNVEAWRRKGDVFSKTDRWGGAIQCYSEAVKHAPGREDIWIAMSQTYIGHGKYKDASRCLDEVLKMNIYSSDAWYLQGIVFSKINRWGAAIQCLDKSLNINPLHIKAIKTKGDLLFETNRYEEAIDCYERGLKIRAEDPIFLLAKARILKSMGRFKMAMGILKRLDVQNKEDPDVLYEIGDVLQETGKAYKALKSFDEALKIKPDFAMAFYKKGVTLEKLRRFSEALSCYEKAVSLDPKFDLAQRALKEIMMKMDEK
jgi:tetratricopeptide (TPR) repeat protein